jgi:hypothetical protein
MDLSLPELGEPVTHEACPKGRKSAWIGSLEEPSAG